MNPLDKISGTIVTGLVISVVIAVGTSLTGASAANSLVIWLHVAAGVTWIGLLYYFNFVQAPSIGEANADAEGPGPAAITKYVAPRALLWFRWAALVTWLSGALFLFLNGTLGDAFELGLRTGNPYATTIGIGAWLGTIMLFNVWILIWPNQKKVLGIVEATAEEKAKGARIAFLASRTNTMLSIPMLMSMVGAGHGFFM
ncbi:MAG: urate hydroxylase PuuD [Gammaproteobacteria bacterium]